VRITVMGEKTANELADAVEFRSGGPRGGKARERKERIDSAAKTRWLDRAKRMGGL